MIPIMFIVCLLGEYIILKKDLYISHGNTLVGVIGGAVLGLIPQCGVPVGCAQLYTKKIVGLSVVMSVFLSSSDEALIIAAGSYDVKFVLKLMFIKVLIGTLVGIILLFVLKGAKIEKLQSSQLTQTLKINGVDEESGSIVKKTVISILHITIYVFIVVFLLNLLIQTIGIETIQQIMTDAGILQVVFAALIGIIPSCASSTLLTESYMTGVISFGGLISGLCANTGYGIIVIFKSMPLKNALLLTALLLSISMFVGMMFMVF